MGKTSLIIVGVLVAITLGATAMYLQIGDDVSSELSKATNFCLSLYDTFAEELMRKGVFDSETTKEVNRAHQKFVYDAWCLSNVDSWFPSDRPEGKQLIDFLKQHDGK